MAVKITQDIYKQIYNLCDTGLNIAIIGDEFFQYTLFNPSSSSNTSSIDFVTIQGICITEFINLNKIDVMNNSMLFRQQYERFIEGMKPLMLKFNKNIEYFLFCQ